MVMQESLQCVPSNIPGELLHNGIPARAARTGIDNVRNEQGDTKRRSVRGKQKREGIGKVSRLGYQPRTIGCLA